MPPPLEDELLRQQIKHLLEGGYIVPDDDVIDRYNRLRRSIFFFSMFLLTCMMMWGVQIACAVFLSTALPLVCG